MTTWEMDPEINLRTERISVVDADRQHRTAVEVLARLRDRAGVIVADEVGMGKTFVAMAVAASVLRSTKHRHPVVVMVPPAVATKWPTDWEVFARFCLPADSPIRVTTSPVRRGSEFLKLLDDPPSRRKHVIFMQHGALRRALRDPFIQLAVIRQAFLHQRDPEIVRRRKVFPRWASTVLKAPGFTEERVTQLLASPPSRWRDLSSDWSKDDDDPVPSIFIDGLPKLDLAPVRAALSSIPLKSSRDIDNRLREVRGKLHKSVDAIWRSLLRAARFQLPLLILDEAHHVKNPNQLASLFSDEADVEDGLDGALFGIFERMVFLTATPFQLGHQELTRVLQRFGAVRLSKDQRTKFESELGELASALDASQVAAARLDRAWGALRPPDVEGLSAGWWNEPAAGLPERVRVAADAAHRAVGSFDRAQEALRPWVIRHRREHRRDVVGGDGILPGLHATGGPVHGIEVGPDAAVPFLLAARAEAMVSLLNLRQSTSSRAIFSEGLASSYEAFRHRARDDTPEEEGELSGEFEWYLKRISEFIPHDDRGVLEAHPKIAATTARVVDLWRRGEKVLIFNFYRATGRALEASIAEALLSEVDQLARNSGTSVPELQRRARNRFGADSPVARLVEDNTLKIGRTVGLDDTESAELAQVVLRFLRTVSYQVRFLPADLPALDAVGSALDPSSTDQAGLAGSVAAFARRVAGMVEVERERVWEDLGKVGVRDQAADDGEASGARTALVRMANGDTDAVTRRRLMTTFNSPFFPEVLIASSVMAEGVDLHLDCRHVIHHDLDWNPSVLEQRTGRVDRVGSKSERLNERIQVFEPFLAGTQDERLYRVVKDRERWFNVVMGGMPSLSQADFDRLAERVPLPPDLEERLTLRLEA